LILDSRKQIDSCLIFMRHAGGNKFSIGLNADSDLEMYNRATGAAQITLPIGGGVTLADGCTTTTQSADDDSTNVATTEYVDAAVAAAGGGGTTYTVLNQNSPSTPATFRGLYVNSGNKTPRQLSTTETDIIVWDQNQSSPNACLQLPLINSVSVGHTISVHHAFNNSNTNIFQHTTDTAGGHKMCNAFGWSGEFTRTNGTELLCTSTRRFVKFIKVARPNSYQGNNHFWLVTLFQTFLD
jgi:hypothetical protein